jgi:hypothetical protein
MIFISEYSDGFLTGPHRDYNMLSPYENKKREQLKLPLSLPIEPVGFRRLFPGLPNGS